MNQYYKLSNDDVRNNFFHPLFSCFEDICSCSMGLCFPYCLFGRIYEKAGFGSCFTGCCKYLSIQIIISLIFSSIIYSIEWNMLLSKEFKFMNNINECNKNSTCKIDYKNFNKTECLIDNTTIICDCLREPLYEQCSFNSDLPNLIENMSIYIFLVSIINMFIIYTMFGLFLGYYRTKISHKYNILYNSRYNFLIHFLPCTNQCALCQEYNTINEIETIQPLQPGKVIL